MARQRRSARLPELRSVAGQPHLPFFPALYHAAIDALAPLRARILVTIGGVPDPVALGPVPPNVHVERWVAHDAVARHAAVIVCHGGFGSTLARCATGFRSWSCRCSHSTNGRTRPPSPAPAPASRSRPNGPRGRFSGSSADTIRQLAPAVARVLGDPAYGREARRIADAARAHPPVDSAVALLTQIGRQGIAA